MKDKIEKLMKEENISFHELARHFNISKQTLTKKINGTLDFTFDELIVLSKVFHIEDPMNYFFG